MSWVIGNWYLSMADMQKNAKEIYDYFSIRNWTDNAIAGILGNMQSESHCNPGVWQGLKEGNYSGGFGLVQWTPATNYTNWAKSNGYEITDPIGQLQWIDELSESKGQWIPTASYNISWLDFKTSEESPEYLASAFLKNFERAGTEVESDRRSQAQDWYEWISENKGVYIVRFVPA